MASMALPWLDEQWTQSKRAFLPRWTVASVRRSMHFHHFRIAGEGRPGFAMRVFRQVHKDLGEGQCAGFDRYDSRLQGGLAGADSHDGTADNLVSVAATLAVAQVDLAGLTGKSS